MRFFAVAAAQRAINPWFTMIEDTNTALLILQRFPHMFTPSHAAQAAATALSISTSLVSLKTRNSDLCTAAYGGYNGALPPQTLLLIFNGMTVLIQEHCLIAAALPCVCRC